MTGESLSHIDRYDLLKSEGIQLLSPIPPEFQDALSPESIKFATELHRKFGPQIQELLVKRKERQDQIDSGSFPDFLPETKHIRESEWHVAEIPDDLQKRHVEITGPVDRKMMINALNSGADVFMADFEDSTSPTWRNIMQGQQNLSDAIDRSIEYTNPEGKKYTIQANPAVLFVRPRGLHMTDQHVVVDGQPISASLFDFGVYFFNNAHMLIEGGSGPYFYLPKLQNHLEARLWNEIFVEAQKQLEIPNGTIRATVLIEHILAAFEMDEILYELKDHSSGLNAGRWDYLFSIIKTFRKDQNFILPDRSSVTMESHMMDSYDKLLVETCHRRGIHAIGGMSAYIPVRDESANKNAFEKVESDKIREAKNGHDGTWVAHPGLVSLARSVFEQQLKGKSNQIDVVSNLQVTPADLLTTPKGYITEQGVRTNIRVFMLYMESWLNGQGAVPINNLMEDAATAEISRSQLWQWLYHEPIMFTGKKLTSDLLKRLVWSEIVTIENEREGKKSESFVKAKKMLYFLLDKGRFVEFLTLEAYKKLK